MVGAVLIVVLLMYLFLRTGSGGSVACRGPVHLSFVAHPDDDLFFQTPDILDDIRAGICHRTVYVTSGDYAAGPEYWGSREAGVQAAYAHMAGRADRWTASPQVISDHPVTVWELAGRPEVSVVFLRIPDGGLEGGGSERYGGVSLQKLYDGRISSISTVDGLAEYTADDLVELIGGIASAQSTEVIRTHDVQGRFGDGDHSDHHAVARFVAAAHQQYDMRSRLISYKGYPVAELPPNVAGEDLQRKVDAYLTYAPHDPEVPDSQDALRDQPEGAWLQRQYAQEITGGDLS
nr:PIG-L family deacetylase [Kineococcus vitellinus]